MIRLSGRQPVAAPEIVADVIRRLAMYRADRETYRHWGPRYLAREIGTTEQTICRWANGIIPKRYRHVVSIEAMPVALTARQRMPRYAD